jgi:hypothetical protein
MEQNKISISVDKTNPAVLRVAAFTANGIRVPASTHDLTDYQGETFRLYMEESGDLSSCKHCDHYWLLLEGNIPPRQTESIPAGEKRGDRAGADENRRSSAGSERCHIPHLRPADKGGKR